MAEHYDAVVIESFGVGGLPSYESGDFYSSIEKWISMGKIVVMTTQVTQEGSNMSVYEVGQKIKNAFGLIESYDMTLEATVTKLMWILGQTKDHDKVREMFYQTINHDILWNTGTKINRIRSVRIHKTGLSPGNYIATVTAPFLYAKSGS